MSFGLGKDPSSEEAPAKAASKQQIEKEMSVQADAFLKKREEKLQMLRKQDTGINVRKSKTPLRLSNNKTGLDLQ